MAGQQFEHYAASIAALPSGRLTAADLMTDTFLLERQGDLTVYYVPFEKINPKARVVLIGITLGLTQMRLAYEVARDGLREGLSHEAVLRRVDQTASYAGSMRINLDRILDQLGLPDLLGIEETEQLFGQDADLMHSTSALPNPVFVQGRNYTGSTPPISLTSLLRRQVLDTLGPELTGVPDAILIPLGRAVEDALGLLIEEGTVAAARCCLGFPHPSGANGHRVRLFNQRRAQLTQTLADWFSASRTPTQPAPTLADGDVRKRSVRAIATTLTHEQRRQLAARLRELADTLEFDSFA
jgi:hypothetical protein